MTNFTRRTLVRGGTALAASGALTGPALLDWAKAWAQNAPWKPEPGAQLSMLRWKYFVQAEDDEFVKLMEAFAKATGVKVTISRESYEDVQPKASVAANTGAGPDLFWGLYSLPHLFPQKCLDVTDVADYLGQKGGGWTKSAAGSFEVRDKVLGIVGYGHIGTQVGVLAESLGMRVIFHDIESKLSLGNARAAASLDDRKSGAAQNFRNFLQLGGVGCHPPHRRAIEQTRIARFLQHIRRNLQRHRPGVS